MPRQDHPLVTYAAGEIDLHGVPRRPIGQSAIRRRIFPTNVEITWKAYQTTQPLFPELSLEGSSLQVRVANPHCSCYLYECVVPSRPEG